MRRMVKKEKTLNLLFMGRITTECAHQMTLYFKGVELPKPYQRGFMITSHAKCSCFISVPMFETQGPLPHSVYGNCMCKEFTLSVS